MLKILLPRCCGIMNNLQPIRERQRVLQFLFGRTVLESFRSTDRSDIDQRRRYEFHDRSIVSLNNMSLEECSSSIETKELPLQGDDVAARPKAHSIEVLDEPGVLDDLKESYSATRKTQSNKWLSFAKRSCHIYLYRGGGEPNSVLAAFDLDGTIIRPKSNKRIPKSATDWDFFSVWTKIKLQQVLREKKARFIIFTNQNGVGLDIVPLEEVQERIELVTKRLDIPCAVFVAVDKNEFRKPRTGMYQLFHESFNESKQIDLEESFYCGDAIGYPTHSDADIKFAQKLGLPFITPDKFVRGVKPKKLAKEET